MVDENNEFDALLEDYINKLRFLESAERMLMDDPVDERDKNKRTDLQSQLDRTRSEVRMMKQALEKIDPARWKVEKEKIDLDMMESKLDTILNEYEILVEEYNDGQKNFNKEYAEAGRKLTPSLSEKKLQLSKMHERIEQTKANYRALKEALTLRQRGEFGTSKPAPDYGAEYREKRVDSQGDGVYSERRCAKRKLNNDIARFFREDKPGSLDTFMWSVEVQLKKIKSDFGWIHTLGFARHINRCLKRMNYVAKNLHDQDPVKQRAVKRMIEHIVKSVRQDNEARVDRVAGRNANLKGHRQQFNLEKNQMHVEERKDERLPMRDEVESALKTAKPGKSILKSPKP